MIKSVLVMSLCFSFLTMGCIGQMGLSGKVRQFNLETTQDRWGREILFVILMILPVYAGASLLDIIVFNSIEFWTGKNPVNGKASVSPVAALRTFGADVVLDISSYAVESVTQAIDFVRTGGTIVLAGMKGFKEIPGFVSDKIVLKEITLWEAIGVTRTGYANAIRLLESRKYDIARMHTHDFKIEEAELAIRTLTREIPGDESIHSCLIPEQ